MQFQTQQLMNSSLKHLLVALLISFATATPTLFAQGKATEQIQKKEKQAFLLYQQGQYKEACDIYVETSQLHNDILNERIIRGLVIFLLVDIIGVLFFLYVEKRKAYLLLVNKNTEYASRPLVNTVAIDFSSADLAEGKDRQILEELLHKMEVEKLYLDSDLSIETLSSQLKTNRNVLSKLVNHHLGRSFPSLINQYRINEAVRLLNDPKTQNYTIEAIAQMCGYNNRQVFHSAFKKETGVTPIVFRDLANSKDNVQ